ncbi:MAG TPA: hypothetical protein VG944_08340 [Fimbriimonas sp.]|nr:hypothetical protein [Fimbriimonas sp.]
MKKQNLPAQPINQLTIKQVPIEGYRNFHADGAIVHLTLQGFFHLNWYCELNEYLGTVKVDIEGKRATENQGDVQTLGLVRQMQAGVFLSRTVAQNMVEILTKKIEEYDKATADPNEVITREG